MCGLLFPIVYVSMQAQWFQFEWDPVLFRVALGAVEQSLGSTVLTLALGGLGALGLLGVSSFCRRTPFQIFQFALVLPGFFPPLLVVTLTVKVLGFLPTGLWSVIFFHVLMNIGLVSVFFFQLIKDRAGAWIEVAQVAAVPRGRFILQGLLRELRFEIQAMAFYLFILYFFSFSIPFLVGGSLYGGIEVFLYEKVVLFGEWGQAAAYSLLLFGFLFLISLFLKEQTNLSIENAHQTSHSFSYLGWPTLTVIAVFPLVFLGAGLVLSLPYLFVANLSDQWSAIRGTVMVGLGVGFSCFLGLSILTYCFLRQPWSKILLAFVHPGWVVVGFAFLLLPGQSTGFSFLKIIGALTILYVPFLYRLNFHERLKDLQSQIQATANFSVRWNRVFLVILFPQILPTLCFLSGLAGLWACGDFAITGFFVETAEVQTVAFQMKEMLSHYRSEQAVQFLWPLLLCGAVVFFVFQGLSYVSRPKIKS